MAYDIYYIYLDIDYIWTVVTVFQQSVGFDDVSNRDINIITHNTQIVL